MVSVWLTSLRNLGIKPPRALRRLLHGHYLLQNDGSYKTFITKVKIEHRAEKYGYQYSLSRPEKHTETLDEKQLNETYAWEPIQEG